MPRRAKRAPPGDFAAAPRTHYGGATKREEAMLFGRVLLMVMLALPGAALAQTSQRTMQIIVPFAPGASADGIGRASWRWGLRSGSIARS